jgi:hypothetical protein
MPAIDTHGQHVRSFFEFKINAYFAVYTDNVHE